MARTTLTKITAPGAYEGAFTTFAFTAFQGTTSTNGEQFSLTGSELIVIRNPTTATGSVVLKSVDDPQGRQEDVTQVMATGEFAVIGPMKLTGWINTDGNFYLEGTSTSLEVAIIKIPGL
jgi:hypothetical protein